MSKRDKRLEKLRQNPYNISMNDLRQVLEDFGFVLKRVKGSHYVFDLEIRGQIETLIIPFTRPHIKSIYIKRSLEIIDSMLADEEVNDD